MAMYSIKMEEGKEGRMNVIKAVYFLLQCEIAPHSQEYCQDVWIFACQLCKICTEVIIHTVTLLCEKML